MTVVNLSSHTVEKTLTVVGHPRTVVSTSNSLFGKVYVASPDSTYVTIIRTDQDIVDTTVLVQGNIVDVRVSSQNGVSWEQHIAQPQAGRGPALLPAARSGTPHLRRTATALQTARPCPRDGLLRSDEAFCRRGCVLLPELCRG